MKINKKILSMIGLVCFTFGVYIIMLGTCISATQDKIEMRLRDACLEEHLTGAVDKANRYPDGKYIVVCTDGKDKWIKTVNVEELK